MGQPRRRTSNKLGKIVTGLKQMQISSKLSAKQKLNSESSNDQRSPLMPKTRKLGKTKFVDQNDQELNEKDTRIILKQKTTNNNAIPEPGCSTEMANNGIIRSEVDLGNTATDNEGLTLDVDASDHGEFESIGNRFRLRFQNG